MPKHPKRKRVRPKPQDLTIRRLDNSEAVETVAPDELLRRKEEAEWQEYRRRHGLDVSEDHARYALQLGDTFTVKDYTGDIWWFVRDVNGPDRTVTAATFLFDQAIERTFPFELVEPTRLFGGHQTIEADSYRRRLGLPQSVTRGHERRRRAA